MSFEEAKTTGYDIVDLIFMNEEYCHFRSAFEDIFTFCGAEESNCTSESILDNMQKNAFSMITQVSQAVAIFKQQAWEDMDQDDKGYAFNQLGHSITQVVVDVIGFKK